MSLSSEQTKRLAAFIDSLDSAVTLNDIFHDVLEAWVDKHRQKYDEARQEVTNYFTKLELPR